MYLQRAAPRVGNALASATSEPGPRRVTTRPFGLPRAQRIRKRTDFQAVYHKGVRLGSKLFTVFALSTETDHPARVGLTVTRKIGNAVTRNRCKRLLREAVRKHWVLLPDGTDMVLHARRGLDTAQAVDVEREIARTLSKAVRRLARQSRRIAGRKQGGER